MKTTASVEPQTETAGSVELAPTGLTRRERFLRACHCQRNDYPPLWLMRQAGRALPEYRELKLKYTFLQLVQTPELAAEVTLQPIRRFDFDGAILFSDILVIPEALGQPYHFRESGGIEMAFNLNTLEEIGRLRVEDVREKLAYVPAALRLIKSELGGKNALLGFAGSPWTLANFMVEGGSSKDFSKAKLLYYTEPKLFEELMEKLTVAVADYLRMQIEAGVDAVQIFDTLGGTLADNAFEGASGKWIREIIARLEGKVPVIVFAKGVNGNWRSLGQSGANVVGVDWTVKLSAVRDSLPSNVGVQGNLDPSVMYSTPQTAAREASRIVSDMAGRNGFIFNLGHGLPPNAKLECIESLVNAVRGSI